jgi:pimeloyl-ACP methyl ester carboxylesterase
MTEPAESIKILELSANGMTFRCRVCGLENSGEPVILLHGFPETSHLWEGIMHFLAAQGYRCLAPDQRGYSSGARPNAVSRYGIDQISSDIVALADALGFSKFHLIGHDWGAGCGWTVVECYPERVRSWAALSIPHMAAFEWAKANDPDQKKRSGYMGFFQLPLIPEIVFGVAAAVAPAKLWKRSSPAEVADYLTVFGNYSGRSAALNWYRANHKLPVEYGNVTLPTILLWGKQDPFVGRVSVELTKPYMQGEYTLIELDAGHTLVQEQFELVKQHLFKHIQQHPIVD